MPQKNTIKTYVKDSYYHIYNRGVEKRNIFIDDEDNRVFLKYIKEYLSPPPEILIHEHKQQGGSLLVPPKKIKNYHRLVDLVAYCLMPNHFHLLIKQNTKESMEGFMRSLCTRYSMYFNKRYERVGKLFQGHYKALIVNTDDYLVHLTKYIHTNPSPNSLTNAYSSYPDYLQLRNTPWVNPKIVLDMFSNKKLNPIFNKTNSYKDFIETNTNSSNLLGNLTID